MSRSPNEGAPETMSIKICITARHDCTIATYQDDDGEVYGNFSLVSVSDALDWARRVFAGDRTLRCTNCGEIAVMGTGLNSAYTVCCGVEAAEGAQPKKGEKDG